MGNNIIDFLDPDISKKLDALEKEEDQLELERNVARLGDDDDCHLIFEEQATLQAIKDKKNISKVVSRAKRTHRKPVLPRNVKGRAKDMHDKGFLDAKVIRTTMEGYGVDADAMIQRGFQINQKKKKRGRSLTRNADNEHFNGTSMEINEDCEMNIQGKKRLKKNDIKHSNERGFRPSTRSRSRTVSQCKESSENVSRNSATVYATKKLERKGKKTWVVDGKSGEGDHRETVHLVKWMNTGKKRMGTHNKR